MVRYISVTCLIFGSIMANMANMRCSNELPSIIPRYYLIEKCRRSKLGVVARANYTSLSSCRRLGIEKKGLAINFSPRNAINSSDDQIDYTCEVLKCAEVSGGLSLTNDTRFDYYSLYAKPIPHVNSTCVPAAGMFHLLKKRLNYTQAAAECRRMKAMLADVISEHRTESLAQFVASSKLEAVYVGMRRRNGTKEFYSANGDSLECSNYRAWAPGHPRKWNTEYDCMVLTPQRTWRSTPCKKQLPALCELTPGGPYKIGSIFPKEKERPVNLTTVN